MSTCLSVLMGGKDIADEDLESINIEIRETDSDGDRKLKMSSSTIDSYLDLAKKKMEGGFWTEVVGDNEIVFLFKYNDGSTRKYELSSSNESEVGALCSKFGGDSTDKTANVYKYLSANSFYRDFMKSHYESLINR